MAFAVSAPVAGSAGTFSPLVKLTYTDGSSETVQRTGYIRAT